MVSLSIQSLRVRQWVKNGVVLVPLVFSGRLLEPASVWKVCVAAACFCLASSGAYVLNDVLDHAADRFHPDKQHRPFASGRLTKAWGAGLASALIVTALLASLSFQVPLGLTVGGYLAVNVLYSWVLKDVVILDVVMISVGFVLRVWGGAVVLGLVPSHWLQLSTFFLALFISLAKRRQELVTLRADAARHRSVLDHYNEAFLDQLIAMVTVMATLSYALYTVSPDSAVRAARGLIYSVPLVIYGLFRYLSLLRVHHTTLSPTDAVLLDRPLSLTVLAWIAFVLYVLYR